MMQRGLVSYLLRQGRVVDPANSVDLIADVYLADGRIAAIGHSLSIDGALEIDCRGFVVCPGLIDLHAHLRVPGFEHKETIESGTSAAAAGGFTTVCCMPNTLPPLDQPSVVLDLLSEIQKHALVSVLPIGTISKGREGLEPVDYAALAEAGVVGFSDDGDSTLDAAVMLEALEASKTLSLPVMVHCEERGLIGGVMHEGDVSRELGLKGLPAEAEELILARDILLAEKTGGWLYALHVSTAYGAGMVRAAKARGVHISAEVMPHHLVMTDHWVAGRRELVNVDELGGQPVSAPDPLAKVNPPLRPEADSVGLLAAVLDGTFDVIATDHAPHAMTEKTGLPIEHAAFGINGFETALPLMLGLVRAGHISMSEMVSLMSYRPANLMGFDSGRLTPGAVADVTVFDPDASWRIEPGSLKTLSPNTPLVGMTVRGRVMMTFVGGSLQHEA